MKRITSTILAACLILTVTACNKDDQPTVTPRTTESEMLETGMSEPNQTIDPVNTDLSNSEITETTAAPSGLYTYTIYAGTTNETTISMGINIDDYILPIEGGGEFLQLGRLACVLGWLEQGQYNWDDIVYAEAGSKIGTANWYTFSYGDHRSMFILDAYSEDMPGVNRSQIMAISFNYLENDSNANFFPGGRNGGVAFEKHYDEVCYSISGQHCMCSRDDAIVIAYGLWYYANNPSGSEQFTATFEKFRQPQGNYQLP